MDKNNFGFKFELDFNETFDFLIGHKFIDISDKSVTSTLQVKDIHKQPGGLVHGGVYCSMAESSCSFGANSYTKGNFVGISQNTDFIKSVKGGHITCISTPIKIGNTIQLWESKLLIGDTSEICAVSRVKLYNLDK